MEFLEVLTEGLERVLMVRGGGREVITIYSQFRRLRSIFPSSHSTSMQSKAVSQAAFQFLLAHLPSTRSLRASLLISMLQNSTLNQIRKTVCALSFEFPYFCAGCFPFIQVYAQQLILIYIYFHTFLCTNTCLLTYIHFSQIYNILAYLLLFIGFIIRRLYLRGFVISCILPLYRMYGNQQFFFGFDTHF